MKKAWSGVLVLGFCFTFTSLVLAQNVVEKKKVIKTVVESAPALSEQERKAIEEKSNEQLNAGAWTIYLTAQGIKKPKVETDMLTFSNGTLVSQNLAAKGYGGSNFSLSAQDDGTAVFETVQRAPDESIALWRGTLSGGNKLTGILNMRPNQGAATIYSFSTSMPGPAVEPEAAVATPKKKR